MAVDDALSVHPTQATFTSGLDLATLTAGRVVEARVVSLAESQAVLVGRFGTFQVDLGTTAATVGDVLRFEVKAVAGGDGKSGPTLSLLGPASTDAAAPAAAAAVDRALGEAVGRAVGRQSGLAPLYAALAGLAGAPAATVPEPVRALVRQLMDARLAASGNPTGASVAEAFRGSGLFLESRLAATGTMAPSQDLKAGLMALADALGDWLGPKRPAPTPPTGPVAIVRLPSSAAAPVETPPAADPGSSAAPTDVAAAPTAAGLGDLSSRRATAAYGAARVPAATPPGAPGATSPGAPAATSPSAPGATPASAAAPPRSGPAASAYPLPPAPSAAPTASPLPATSAVAAAPPSAAIAAVAAKDVPLAPAAAGADFAAPPRPGIPLAAADVDAAAATVTAAASAADERTRTDRILRPPPPRRGAVPRGQPPLPPETAGSGSAEVESLGRRALDRTEGALQRILLEQYAVLDRHDDPTAGTAAGRQSAWTAELPIATRDGTGVVQLTVERDGGGRGGSSSQKPAGWRVRFALDVEPLGPVTAQVGLAGEHLSIGLWIERPEVAARLAAGVGELRGALEAAAIPVEAIHVAAGRPPEAAKPAASGRFVDVSL